MVKSVKNNIPDSFYKLSTVDQRLLEKLCSHISPQEYQDLPPDEHGNRIEKVWDGIPFREFIGVDNESFLQVLDAQKGVSRRSFKDIPSAGISTKTAIRIFCLAADFYEVNLAEYLKQYIQHRNMAKYKGKLKQVDIPEHLKGHNPPPETKTPKQPILELPEVIGGINHYTSRTIEHVLGRDEEQQTLRDFLKGDGFLWLQLAGEAGQGKSRLALELMLEYKDEWAVGEVKNDQLKEFKDKWHTWQPDKPHLFVMDYVIGNEDNIRPFLQTLCQRTDFSHAVRVLLVERQRWDKGGFARPNQLPQTDGNPQSVLDSIDFMEADRHAAWFLSLAEPINADGNEFYTKQQRIIQQLNNTHFDNEGVVELKALDDDALYSITKKITEKQGTKLLMPQEDVLERLQKIDRSRRPLYAYFFGQALAEGGGNHEDIQTRDDLLKYALKRQFQRRWVATFGKDSPIRRNDTIAHRLAVIATITRGIDYKEAKDDDLIATTDAASLARAMVYTDTPLRTDDEYTSGNIIFPLEPDILGEYMVLDSLQETLPVNELLSIAWLYNPEQTASFIQRLTQDFPDHTIITRILQLELPNEKSLIAFSDVAATTLFNLHQHDKRYDFPKKLIDALKYAADEKADSVAMNNLAVCYWNGQGVEKDYEQAFEWYNKASDKGHSGAMLNIGYFYSQGLSVEKDERKALGWFFKAANQGNTSAMHNIGLAYTYGTGIKKDKEKAVEWYRKAADKGYEEAMFNLGLCYESGFGVDRDKIKAVEWYRKAARKEHAKAMCKLGKHYSNGDGIEKNYKEAVKWYKKSANSGDRDAMFDLCWFYLKGSGVEQSNKEAIKWCKNAADKKSADAMFLLGEFYAKGFHVKQDNKEALKWYRKSLDEGNSKAIMDLLEVKKLMRFVGQSDDFKISTSPTNWTKKQLASPNCLWEDIPPITGNWKEFTGKTIHTMCNLIEKSLLEDKKFSHLDNIACQKMRYLPLSFYPDCQLIDIQLKGLSSNEVLLMSALFRNNKLMTLNIGSQFIYKINPHLLRLNSDQTAIDYLKFFCAFKHRRKSEISPIIDTIDSVPACYINKFPTNLSEIITPITHVGGSFNDDGFMQFTATTLDFDSIYLKTYEISSSGVIETKHEEVIESNLHILERGGDNIFRTPPEVRERIIL